ncbi:larval/pupal cuticle protein H1C-like isoform X1 [Penaeus japonicus]|uniref:larval/pupal cuticle protein H1C-like isoform X1 n=1 Tax=Penaeus japonicus TaxID=27405 RepID=UPI001C70B430|nr:larval/pupal cuticle protein H1C-like isoform X1 [Penaeus japonicus]
MNALRLVCAFAAIAVCRAGVARTHSILSPHVALPHSLPYDSVGVQQVPVAAVSHHAPSVTVKHHGAPLLHVAPSVHKTSVVHHGAPVVAHGGLSVSHSAPVAAHGAVAVSHSAPVAVSHGVARGSVAVSGPVAVAHAAPVAVHHAAPLAVSHSVPVASHVSGVTTPVKSQYHAQDELGQYSFGYNAGDSARHESRDAYGNVRGSFSYVDSYGNVQSQNYVADDYGFRVEGTNLPRAKRSYGSYPASTGPLTTVSHVAPVVHAAPAVAHVAHAAHGVAHVAHAAPAVAHVAHAAHAVAPVATVSHAVAPVATVSHAVAPAAHIGHAVGPVAHSGVYGYSSPLRGFSYGYRTGPSVSTYRSYAPALGYSGHY